MKKLFVILILATTVSTVLAQDNQKLFVDNNSKYGFRATWPEFSYNGKAQIYTKSHKEEIVKQTFTFYSDEFEKQRELTISGVEYLWSEKRESREWKDGGYKGDWVTYEDSGKSYGGIIYLNFDDFDQSCSSGIYLSQTLFNTDEKYEFLMPLYSSDTYTEEYDIDGDGIVDHRETSTGKSIIGFQIVSEDGTVLQIVNFDYGFYIPYIETTDLLKINGKLYLCFSGKCNDSDAVLLCSIDSANSTVRVMSMEKVSSVPTRSYNISGRPTKGEKGINIIRMSDGTTKKVIVR